MYLYNTETLVGGDLSHHNWITNPSAWSFVFLKATEGKTWVDDKFDSYIKLIADTIEKQGVQPYPPFIGAYHFARPENNKDVNVEVEHFLNKIKPHVGNCMIALDWEDNALRVEREYGAYWALQWLRKVKEKTGTIPFFYVQLSVLQNYPEIEREFPIWVAHYHKQGLVDDCHKYQMWQITSTPFDIDIFNGGRVEMAKLIQGIE